MKHLKREAHIRSHLAPHKQGSAEFSSNTNLPTAFSLATVDVEARGRLFRVGWGAEPPHVIRVMASIMKSLRFCA